MGNNKLKGAIYARVSTDKQEYQRQIAELERYAELNNIDIIYKFEEKESGTNDDRAEYKKLQQLTKNDIDVVLVWELSRLSRNSIEIQKRVEEFVKKKINIYVKNVNLNVLGSDNEYNPTSKLLISIISTIASSELDVMKERVISSKRDYIINRGRSYTSIPPFGYKIVDKKIMIDENEVDIVKEIYEKSNEGVSTYRICDYLNSKGITNKGKKFTQAMILGVLKNSLYVGKYTYTSNKNKKPVTDSVYNPDLKIIEESVWISTQKKLSERRVVKSLADKSERHLLQGLLICSDCGKRLTYENTKVKRRYKCQSCYTKLKIPAEKRKICSVGSFKAEMLEEVIFKSNIKKSVLNYTLSESKKRVKSLEDEKSSSEYRIKKNDELIESLQNEIKRLVNKIYSDNFNDLLRNTYESVITEKAEDITKIKKENSAINSQIADIQDKINKLKTASGLSINKDRYGFIHKTIEKIIVYSESGFKNSLFVVHLFVGRIYYIFLNPYKGIYTVSDPVTEDDVYSFLGDFPDAVKTDSIKEYVNNYDKYSEVSVNYFDEEKKKGIILGKEVSIKEYINYNLSIHKEQII